jgi:ribosomal protein S18 acetylase RimI-like enzyme
MDFNIRLMQTGDLEVVRRLIPSTFSDLFARETGVPQHLPIRNYSEMECYLTHQPEGSFVAVGSSGRIVGCVFCHIWGETGWLGPLVVHPSFQGRGIGSRLLGMATDFLESKCAVVGLETMPQTVANLNLYLRYQYYPEFLRLRMYKTLDASDVRISTAYPVPNKIAMDALLPDISRISRTINPLLDYGQEAESAYMFGLGACIFSRSDAEADGFMIYHQIPDSRRVVVKAMAMDSQGHDSDNRFRQFLRQCEAVLEHKGFSDLVVPVYAGHEQAVKVLVAEKYQVIHAGVRMYRRGGGDGHVVRNRIDLCQWSG